MRDSHVVVVGDLMLDEYLWGEIARISPEAPVPVMHLHHVERSLGGAANVARNVASLGARVTAVGVVGADSAATSIIEELDRAGINRECVLVEPTRVTTRKCRLMSLEHRQQVFRFDDETTDDISPAAEDRLLALVRERMAIAQVIICSDYLKGVLTKGVLQETAAVARKHGIPLVTAPKDISPEKYAGASVLMSNLREFARLAGHRMNGNATTWIDQAAWSLSEAYKFSTLLVTRGPDGMTLFEQTAGGVRREEIAAVTRSVYDVTGAGDTALGVFSLCLAAGATRSQAAQVANVAAGIVVGKRGTAYVTLPELLGQMCEVGESLCTAVHASKEGVGRNADLREM
jgi:D-beta-D-heptose 7-phosphate kinase/D-beta-D-heptose 1-phosphate adenosyltransferase